MIFMVYSGVFLLAYGIYHLIAHLAYLPSEKSGRSISSFWKAICFELALYIMQRFSLTGVSSNRLKKLLKLNHEKKEETAWMLEKCIGSIGVFFICSPLLLIQTKIFLIVLGVGLIVVWHELLLYCSKNRKYKIILQQELSFFMLLRWKYFSEGRDELEYLEACQMAMTDELSKDRLWISAGKNTMSSKDAFSVLFINIDLDTPQIDCQKKYELSQRKRLNKIEKGIKNRYIKIQATFILSIFIFIYILAFFLLQ